MTGGRQHSSWAISLTLINRGVLHRDVSWVVKAVIDVVSCSEAWRAAMSTSFIMTTMAPQCDYAFTWKNRSGVVFVLRAVLLRYSDPC